METRDRRTKRTRKSPSPNSILDRRALLRALDDRGLAIKPFHITGFYQALHRQHYPDLPDFVECYHQYEREVKDNVVNNDSLKRPLKNNMTNRAGRNKNKTQLPRKLLDFLQDPDNGFVTVTSRVAQRQTSGDGTTTKLAIQLQDGQLVESVLMRYITKDGSRASLCVSSQCGCAMGCTFCATGTMGLSGNLTAGEILEQIVHADRILAEEWEQRQKENNDPAINTNNNIRKKKGLQLDLVRNVVFMGMGEPLDNYSNVLEACRALVDRKWFNLAYGRVAVSTVGLVPQIRKLTQDLPEVALALSLHAPNQKARSAIVPTAKNFPIEKLIEALDGHMMAYLKKRYPDQTEFTAEQRIQESARRRAMIEYVMLEGETSTMECAHQLGKLCENRHLIVNLIPYNQTNVKDKLRCPSREHIEAFRKIVMSYGAFCTVRKTMGADIASACGQLITLEDAKKAKQNDVVHVRDIEDTGIPKADQKICAVNQEGVYGPPEVADDTDCWKGWVGPLCTATSVAACCFVVSTGLLLLRQRQR